MKKANCAVRLIAVFLLTSFHLFSQSSDSAREKAVALVQQMTLEEKIDYIGGTGFAIGGSTMSPPSSRCGIPANKVAPR